MADHAISEQGPDFVADHQVVESHLLPVRPQSRLGFNPTPGHPQAPAVTGSSSLAPDVGPTSYPTPTPTSTLSPSPSLSPPSHPAPLDHPAAVALTTAHCDSVQKIDVGASTLSTCAETNNTFQSPYGNSETPRSHPGSPAPQSPTPRPTTPKSPTSPRSVSRLCFPFVTTRSKSKPQPIPPPRPPPRHKYSSFAHSPLSPFSNDRPAPAHQRHKYSDHGRSRSGLEQVKDFWSTRKDQWKDIAPDDDQVPALAKAYSDRPLVASPRSAGRLGHESMPAAQEPITVHPRRGDIQALRDPFCVDMDICFADLPPWTMSKVLWMLDLHKMLALKNGTHRGDEEPSDSESDYDTCTSTTGFSSDSDATLVESESESDLPRLGAGKSAPPLVGVGAKVEQFTDPEGGKCRLANLNQRTIRGRKETLRPSVLPITTSTATTSTADKTPDWPLSVYMHGRPGSSASSSSSEYDSSWATNWYQRWDILTELSREHWDDKNISHTVNPIGRNWDPRSTFHHPGINKGIPGRRFFIFGGSGHHLEDPHDPWNHRFGSFRRTK